MKFHEIFVERFKKIVGLADIHVELFIQPITFIKIVCSQENAKEVWKKRYNFAEEAYKLGIPEGTIQFWVNHLLLGDISVKPNSTQTQVQKMIEKLQADGRSEFAKQYPQVIQLLAEFGSVSIHSSDVDTGYPYLFVYPFRGIEARLCKPVEHLISQPARAAVGVIGQSKIATIEQTIAISETMDFESILNPSQGVRVSYECLWQDINWQKECRGIKVNENEILVLTQDLDPRQIWWWEQWVKNN